MPELLSVNIARETAAESYSDRPTAIGKRPVTEPVVVRDPGSKKAGLGSGLVGDVIGDHRHHGGSEQAVYSFARENLDRWQARLGRPLPDGAFGENLTTYGLDVDGARLGERWRIGAEVVLQVTSPRIPCGTFRGWLGVPGWLEEFTADARPGAYLSVVTSGSIRAGDAIEVVHRPAHEVTIAMTFRALMGDKTAMARLPEAGDDLVAELRDTIARA